MSAAGRRRRIASSWSPGPQRPSRCRLSCRRCDSVRAAQRRIACRSECTPRSASCARSWSTGPGSSTRRLTPSNAEELLFDDVLWVSRAKAEHDAFCRGDARARRRGVPGRDSCSPRRSSSPRSRTGSCDHILNERQVGIAAPQRAREWVETADAGPGRRLPHRRHHQGRRRAGRRAGVGVGRSDEHAAAAAAELPVPARPVVLDLRRRHDQPDDEAGPQAGDDDRGGDLPLPPDVRGRAVPDLARRRRRGLGPRATSRAATCSRSATAR